VEDRICDAWCALRSGKYDGLTAEKHLEHILRSLRAAPEAAQ
jgi:hypothetical protein